MQRAVLIRSLSQLRTNPLRTLLTLLGMVFGVGSVVAMVSIGEGAQREILASIEAMGATAVHVRAKPIADSELSDVVNDSAGLQRSDLAAILQVMPGVERAAFRARHQLQTTDLPVPAHSVTLLAVSPELFEVHGLRVASGRALLPLDHSLQRRVAVVGASLAKRAFPDGVVLGARTRLEYSFFEVVGVLEERAAIKGDLPIDPQVYADAILVPFDTVLEELRPSKPYGELDMLSFKLPSTAYTLPAKNALLPLLKSLHGAVNDFEVVAPEEILQQKKAAQSVLNIVLVCIAAISLVVGGIGVMNIMLANIMERISEIGLRRAIGARKRDIRNQFLTESVLICFVGGVIGIVLGFAIAFVVTWVVELPIAFAWESMIASFVISVLVGLVFGLVPAMRAAGIDPIEALHAE